MTPVKMQRHAMTQSDLVPPTNGPIAVDAACLAQMLGLSVRTIRRLDAAGKLPRPIKIGGAVRWRRAEIELWLEADCPDRQRWESVRAGQLTKS